MIYGLIYNTPDYTNTIFDTDFEKITTKYLEEVVEVRNSDDEYVTGIALIHITGNGNLEIGHGINGGDGVEVLRSWSINEKEF